VSRVLELDRRRATTSDRLRVRAIAVAERGPAGMVPALAAVALFVGVAGELLLVLGSAPGARPTVNELALWSLRGLAAAGLAGLIVDRYRRRRAGSDETPPVEPYVPREAAPRDLLTAAMLAAAVVLPVLLVPVHYMAARTHPTTLVWNHYGFLDKRWLTSLFLTATIGSALALATAARAVGTALQRPESWRVWAAEILPARGPGGERESVVGGGWVPTALKLLCAAAVAAYFFGPPWHLAPTPIDYHEALTMGGVQAVRTGSVPYLDAAAVQYGPAAQLANAAYVAVSGRVSVDGFRETSLLLHWIAATLFLGALVLRVRPLIAAVTALAAITIFPTLQVFSVTPAGYIDGFWGWTNTLRYAGVFLLAMAFPALAARAGAAPARARSVALGVAWGILSLVAQENLIGGALVLGVLSVLLVVTGTYGRRAVLTALGGTVAGFVLVAVPVCVFYAAHGALARFLGLYWLVPSAVAAGYSNTPFGGPAYAALYYGLPFLLGGLLLAALLSGRPLRVATAWTQRRVVLVSALVAALICHLGALTRSDPPHLINTELALPAAVCLAAFYLPGLLGARSRRSQWIGGLAIAIAALALLPLTPRLSQPKLVAQKLWQPLHARVSPPAEPPRPAGIPVRSGAAARVGDSTVRQPRCCTKGNLSMAQLVGFLDRLHTAVGGRRVLVDSTTKLTPPAVYFLADLRPAPFLQDRGTMVLNTSMDGPWYAYMHAHLAQTQAIVTTSLSRPAPREWLAAYPRHQTIALHFAGMRVLVLNAPSRTP
jgi:hypothetical protein